MTGAGRRLAVSGSSPDTRAVCRALITLMWGLGRVVLCSEEGCEAGAGERERASASGTTEETREQPHLRASIINKMPAATKANRDQKQENRMP